MAEQLKRELAEIVRGEIKDPRLGFVSFTEVRMSRDLSHALIYTTVLDSDLDSARQQESIDILNNAAGFIRSQVAKRIRARIVPTLKFVLDDSITRGAAMDELISEAIESDRKHAGDDSDNNDRD
jgi:ribosome-binding factor A